MPRLHPTAVPSFSKLLLLAAAFIAVAVAQKASDVSQGLFARNTGPEATCPATLTLRDTSKPGTMQLELDGTPCVPATTLTFTDRRTTPGVPADQLRSAGIAALLTASLPAPVQCGARSLPAGTGFMFARITSSTAEILKPILLPILGANDEFKPFVSAVSAVDLSPGEVVGATNGCAWRRTGDAPGSSSSSSSTASPSPSTGSVSNDTVDVSACFPAAATVQLASGATVPLSALRVGHRVRVGPGGAHSPVIAWTHRDARARHTFLRLALANGAAVSVSRGHYVYADGRLRAAADVRVGMRMQDAAGKHVAVVAVSPVRAVGLFNPQTAQGDIVVDGVRCSTYTTAVPPPTAHALLAPVRAAFGAVRWLLFNTVPSSASVWMQVTTAEL